MKIVGPTDLSGLWALGWV